MSDARLDTRGVSDPGGAALYAVDVGGSALRLLAEATGGFPEAFEAPLSRAACCRDRRWAVTSSTTPTTRTAPG